MGTATLDRVLRDVRTLSADELSQVRACLDGLAPSDEQASSEQRLADRLRDLGVVTQVPADIAVLERLDAVRRAVPVRGEPVSVTLVGDRR